MSSDSSLLSQLLSHSITLPRPNRRRRSPDDNSGGSQIQSQIWSQQRWIWPPSSTMHSLPPDSAIRAHSPLPPLLSQRYSFVGESDIDPEHDATPPRTIEGFQSLTTVSSAAAVPFVIFPLILPAKLIFDSTLSTVNRSPDPFSWFALSKLLVHGFFLVE
ncbi:unnamed protein product [Linum trigynum]|uniref:Uncharacterized protein n=1 Tax=Linum trigynum TaxID=586398 RepID=A0AAV2DW96_9ROSI